MTAQSPLESSFEKLTIATQSDGKVPTKPNGNPSEFYLVEELEAIRKVVNELKEVHNVDPARIGLKTLAITTIVSKLRVDEAASKYAKYLEMVSQCGVPNLCDDQVLNMSNDELRKWIGAYAACGRDSQGRSIMWVTGNKSVSEEEEPDVVKAAIMYHTAIHADALSLRQGITFIIDTSNKPAKREKNDQKLQKLWQAMPMRPQAILIAGASLPLRVIINSLILVASFFTKQKVLDRIKFVKIEDAFNSVPLESAPKYLGGKGGDIEDIVKWTKDRLDSFPVPIL